MERNILIEVNRVREIMGLGFLIKEQTVDTNPDVIRTIDGDEYKVTTTDIEPFKSGKWSATFPAGKFKGADIQGSIDTDVQKLAVWLDNPALVNATIVVSINAGSSTTPIGVGGALETELNALGKPGNKGLAELRAETAVELVKPKLQAVVPPEIFKNITWVIDVSQVEKGPEFCNQKCWEDQGKTTQEAKNLADSPSDEKFVKYQFLSATAGVTGQEETLEKMPVPRWCDGAKVGKKGGGKGEKENGYRAVSDNDWKGAEYDMGEGEAVINLLFNSFTVPDMFQVTYNNEVYTSTGPDGKIGFVSGRFNGLTEKEELKWMVKLNRLKAKILKSEDTKFYRSKNFRDYCFVFEYYGIPCREGNKVDILWLNEFFKRFPPMNANRKGEKDALKDIKPGKEEYNPDFIRHPMDFLNSEGSEDKRYVGWAPDKDQIKTYKKLFWGMVQEASKKLRGKTNELVKKYEDMENLILKLRAGDPDFYAWWKSKELWAMRNAKNIPESAKKGFTNGVIGDQGMISFTKVPGANKFLCTSLCTIWWDCLESGCTL